MSRFSLAALALVVFAGCCKVSTNDAVRFNDELVVAGKRVSISGLAFSVAAVKAIVKVLDDPLITADVRVRKLRPIANYLNSIDQDQVGNLRQGQAAFAGEHGFQIKK